MTEVVENGNLEFNNLNDDLYAQLITLNRVTKNIYDLLYLLLQEKINDELVRIFNNPKEISIYELSDGIRTTREIGGIVGVSKNVISSLWQKWKAIGIMETKGVTKSYKAKYTLVELVLNQKIIEK